MCHVRGCVSLTWVTPKPTEVLTKRSFFVLPTSGTRVYRVKKRRPSTWYLVVVGLVPPKSDRTTRHHHLYPSVRRGRCLRSSGTRPLWILWEGLERIEPRSRHTSNLRNNLWSPNFLSLLLKDSSRDGSPTPRHRSETVV